MTVTITPDATSLSAALAAFKAHLRLVGSDMDCDLTQILKAAYNSAGHVIGQVVIKSVVVLEDTMSSKDGHVTLRLRGPVISLTSVTVDGVDVTSDCTFKSGVLTIEGDYTDADVVVTYTAGWISVPADIQNAVFLIGASLFANPLDSVEVLPKASAMLLRPYRWEG